MKAALAALLGLVVAGSLALLVAPLLLLEISEPPPTAVCEVGGVESLGLSTAQQANASTILSVATAVGVGERGQVIAIATALTESELLLWANDGTSADLTEQEAQIVALSLTLPHDAVGSDWDSVNFFQQRPSSGWGEVVDLMDATYAARAFFGGPEGPNAARGWPAGLLDVTGWEELSEVDAADAVQGSAHPERVGEHLEQARAIVAALAGTGAGCTPGLPGASGPLGVGGYSHPVPGFVTFQGNFGQAREGYTHAGEDLSAAAGTPILAASDGIVTHVSCAAWSGRSPCNILIDHGTNSAGQSVQTLYVHMYSTGVLVGLGQSVSAGQQIGKVGSNGNSTGPHLHFEVWIGGVPVNPTSFLAGLGINLRDPAAPPVQGTGGSGAAVEVLAYARSQLGDGYSQTQQAGCGPDWWDCSCLVREAWARAGKSLPRTTSEQWDATSQISEEQLQPGDLVFYSSNGAESGIYHVALYAGNGKIIQAPNPAKTVEEIALYRTNLFGFTRVP